MNRNKHRHHSGFDNLAPEYDRSFSHTLFGRILRERFYETTRPYFHPGSRILDLGCGTAEDASYFAGKNISVTGMDNSAGMLQIARMKNIRDASFVQSSLHPKLCFQVESFDAVYSHLGAFNCVPPENHPVAELHRILKPDGYLIFSLMNRVYLLEILMYLFLFSPSRAFRRFRAQPVDVQVSDAIVPVWYPRLGILKKHYKSYFDTLEIIAQPVLIPPPAFTNRFSAGSIMTRILKKIDDTICRVPGVRMLGDHVILILRKKKF